MKEKKSHIHRRKNPSFSAKGGSASGGKFGGQWRFRKDSVEKWIKAKLTK